MIENIAALTKERWPDLYPGTDAPTEFHYVLQSRNKVILFLFAKGNGTSQLVAVVKVSRAPKDNITLERSVERMHIVRSQLTGSLQRTVPKAFILGRISGLSCAVEEALPGEPMEIFTLRWRLGTKTGKNIRAFADWLIAFQNQIQAGQCHLDFSEDSKTLASLKVLLNISPIPESTTALLSHLEQNTPSLQLPLSWRVGDTHHSNILMCDGQVCGVVDWDGSQPNQWVIFDWFQFVFEYAREYSKKLKPGRGRRENADLALRMLIAAPSDKVSTVLQKETIRFLDTYGLTASHFPILFLAFLDKSWPPHDRTPLIQRALSLLETEWPEGL